MIATNKLIVIIVRKILKGTIRTTQSSFFHDKTYLLYVEYKIIKIKRLIVNSIVREIAHWK